MIRPYLCDIINNQKTQGEWTVNSGNTVIDHKLWENEKFNYQWQLSLYLQRILMKFVLCIQ